MEIILPPIQGTILTAQSPLFKLISSFESSAPLGPEASSKSGICLAFSASTALTNLDRDTRIGWK